MMIEQPQSIEGKERNFGAIVEDLKAMTPESPIENKTLIRLIGEKWLSDHVIAKNMGVTH